MIIRPALPIDSEAVTELFVNSDFDFPSTVFAHAVIEKEGKVVAYGAIRPVIEFILILNCSLTNIQKAKAIKLLHKKAEDVAEEINAERICCFINNDKFIELMKKHFGYRSGLIAKEVKNGWIEQENQ